MRTCITQKQEMDLECQAKEFGLDLIEKLLTNFYFHFSDTF